MWIYVDSEPGLWTVGHYTPDGKWHTDSDHTSKGSAANRVHWLNGGGINEDLLAACEKAFFFVDDEDNNKEIVHMNGSFGLWEDLREAIEKATGDDRSRHAREAAKEEHQHWLDILGKGVEAG